jgi:hypothetical protein
VTDVLTRRELNRATLARQFLLERADVPVTEVLTRVVGMQAQAPNPPYYGLWARLTGFRPDDLAELVTAREVVRLSLMRSTIHLVTADDALYLRSVLQPAQERAFLATYAKRLEGLDVPQVLAAAVEILEAGPETFAVLGKRLQERYPGCDVQTLSNLARTFAPLVQVPPRGLWGSSGQATHTTARAWLGRDLSGGVTADEMVLRYLAGFGPASVADAQVWSGLTRLKEVFERLRPRLRTFRSESGVELFDLPDSPRPGGDADAPVRIVAEFENLLLSYADRSRVISEEHRKRIFTPNGLIPGTFLVNGEVAGTWRLTAKKKTALLEFTPFGKVSKRDRARLEAEGGRLLAFAVPGAEPAGITFGQ